MSATPHLDKLANLINMNRILQETNCGSLVYTSKYTSDTSSIKFYRPCTKERVSICPTCHIFRAQTKVPETIIRLMTIYSNLYDSKI